MISPQKMDKDKKPRFHICIPQDIPRSPLKPIYYNKVDSLRYSAISTETEKLVALTLTTFFGPNIQELSKFECLEFQGVNIDV